MTEHQKIIDRISEEKREFLELFKETPNILFVCHKVGIVRSTFYRWRKEDVQFDKDFKEADKIGRDNINDVAEMSLVQLIKEKDFKATTYYLKHNHPRYSDSNNSLKESDVESISSGINEMGKSFDNDKSFFSSLFKNKIPTKIIQLLQKLYRQILKGYQHEEEKKKLDFIYKLQNKNK